MVLGLFLMVLVYSLFRLGFGLLFLVMINLKRGGRMGRGLYFLF